MSTGAAGAARGGDLAQHVGQRLRACRSARNLTLSEMSDQMGTHLNTVHKLEKGRGTIMLHHMEQMLNALGLELAVVPIGTREFVENWEGWSDPELLEQSVECCGKVDPQSLLEHVRRFDHDDATD